MPAPPEFADLADHVARNRDAAFWRPYLDAIRARHDLPDAAPVAGFNVTYPTFICGDVVIKLFGYSKAWRPAAVHEVAAYRTLAADPAIAVPRLVATGDLYDDPAAPWPYLVTTRVAGQPVRAQNLTKDQWQSLAATVGDQVRRLHALSPAAGVATIADWPAIDVTAANRAGSLPPHLIDQIDAYLATHAAPADVVFTHADIALNHTYVDAAGTLTAIIDWGDAMAADRHYELIQPYRDLFGGDKTLFRLFLDAAHWLPSESFADRALAHALIRQAIGLAQHHTMDVFEPIAQRHDLTKIPNLQALAARLFG